MTLQADLFTSPPPVRVHRSLAPGEKVRLSAQCQRILSRLQQGRASNRELAEIALKYTSRISDLRAAGYVITVQSRDQASGRVIYQLETPR